MDDRSQRGVPVWFWGAIVALILIGLSTRGTFGVRNDALVQQFAAQPTPAGVAVGVTLPQLDLSNLSPGLREAAEELRRTIGLGRSGSPLEPNARNGRVQVVIAEIAPVEGGMLVRGEVTNVGAQALNVPISAFELRDSAGGSYIAGGGASANLQPGESTPLELTVPLPPGLGLMLVTNLPPDPPLEQRLLAAEE